MNCDCLSCVNHQEDNDDEFKNWLHDTFYKDDDDNRHEEELTYIRYTVAECYSCTFFVNGKCSDGMDVADTTPIDCVCPMCAPYDDDWVDDDGQESKHYQRGNICIGDMPKIPLEYMLIPNCHTGKKHSTRGEELHKRYL